MPTVVALDSTLIAITFTCTICRLGTVGLACFLERFLRQYTLHSGGFVWSVKHFVHQYYALHKTYGVYYVSYVTTTCTLCPFCTMYYTKELQDYIGRKYGADILRIMNV